MLTLCKTTDSAEFKIKHYLTGKARLIFALKISTIKILTISQRSVVKEPFWEQLYKEEMDEVFEEFL